MDENIHKSFREIDQFTDHLLNVPNINHSNVNYSRSNLDPALENKFALNKLDNVDPNRGDLKHYEILICLSKKIITEEQAIGFFDDLKELYRVDYLRSAASRASSLNISTYKQVLSYLRNIKGTKSLFLRDFKDEFLDLMLKKRYFKDEFDIELINFYNQFHPQFTQSDWTSLNTLLAGPHTPSTRKIATEIITQKKESQAYQNLGVNRLIHLYASLNAHLSINDLYKTLDYSTEEIDDFFLLPKEENQDVYGGYIESFNLINSTLELPLKKKIIHHQEELNIINVPDLETGWFIHYANFMNIGYHFYVSDCDEHFPIPYDIDFKEFPKKIYVLLNMEVDFLFNYELIYNNEKPIKEAYQLVLQQNEKQYQLSFEHDLGCRNADLFMALNNKLLKDQNIAYRFLRLDESNYVITNEQSIPTMIKLYHKFSF